MADSPWLTVGLVLSWIKDQDEADLGTIDRPALQLACNAVAEFVEGRRGELFTNGDFAPTATLHLGAIMYAVRLYERRGTMMGVAGFGDLGSSPILRQDPDIARLLGTDGESSGFVFGGSRRRFR